MRNIKYIPHFFSMYDHTGICRHLEKQAQEGWMLEKTGTFAWKYRRCEPRQIHFAINYFPKASEFAAEPTEEQKVMFEYCEQAGWKHISTVAQMQIFCNEQENPVPLETDAATQVEIISKAMKSSFLPAQILLFVLAVIQLGMFVSRFFKHPVDVLTDSMNLFSGVCWISVILLTGMEFINYFTWLKRARIAAKEEERFVATRSFPKFQMIVLVIIVVGMLYAGLSAANESGITMIIYVLLYMPILFGGVNLTKRFLKSRKVSTGVTRALTITASFVLSFAIVFVGIRIVMNSVRDVMEKQSDVESYEYRGITWKIYHDDLPLVIEDLTDTDYEKYSYEMEVNETFLAAEYEAAQRPRRDDLEYPDLYYRIVKLKVPMFYDICKNGILEEYDRFTYQNISMKIEYWDGYEQVDPKIWQAKEVYREYRDNEPQGNYLVCWEDKLLEISFDQPPTEEQIAVTVEKLKDF